MRISFASLIARDSSATFSSIRPSLAPCVTFAQPARTRPPRCFPTSAPRPAGTWASRLTPSLSKIQARCTSTTSTADAENETRTLLIVYHTLTGGSEQMAGAAYKAATAAAAEEWESDGGTPPPKINVRMLRARDAGPTDILSSSAYLFVCPENLATMAGIMKDFFDRSFYAVLGRTNGRAYAAMICAGSDGQGAMRQLDRICTGWRLKRAAEGIIVITHAQTAETCHAMKTIPPDELEQCAEVGAAMVEGLRMGVW